MTDDVRAATWICNSKKPPPTLNRRITSGNVDPCVNAACGQFIPWAIIMHEWSQADSAKVAGQEVDDQEIVSYRIYFRSIQYTQCKFTEKESRHTSINDTKNTHTHTHTHTFSVMSPSLWQFLWFMLLYSGRFEKASAGNIILLMCSNWITAEIIVSKGRLIYYYFFNIINCYSMSQLQQQLSIVY